MPATPCREAYPTALTDAQGALLAPWLSVRAWTGRPRTVDLREVVDAVFYLLRTGCQWRQLPHDFPHWCTVRSYYDLWMWNGTWVRINTALCAADRERLGREAQPSAVVMDSQSARATESGGERGYDGGKQSGGPATRCAGGYRRARLGGLVVPADWTEQEGGRALLAQLVPHLPRLLK